MRRKLTFEKQNKNAIQNKSRDNLKNENHKIENLE